MLRGIARGVDHPHRLLEDIRRDLVRLLSRKERYGIIDATHSRNRSCALEVEVGEVWFWILTFIAAWTLASCGPDS